jgi:hypothetical protein
MSPLVLAIVQEKLNNPSPDDPFEPEIASVSPAALIYEIVITDGVDADLEKRPCQIFS